MSFGNWVVNKLENSQKHKQYRNLKIGEASVGIYRSKVYSLYLFTYRLVNIQTMQEIEILDMKNQTLGPPLMDSYTVGMRILGLKRVPGSNS